MMKGTSPAKQFFYVMVTATILGFCGILAAFYWGNEQLETKAATIANLQADRDIAREKILALQSADQDITLVDEATTLLDNLLPTQKRQETLVADVIYTATSEAGVPARNLSALTFSGSEQPSDLSGTETFKDVPGVLSYPFNMVIQDISYTTLLRLLDEIENNDRLVQVDDLQISPDQNNPDIISSVSLSLKAFLQP